MTYVWKCRLCGHQRETRKPDEVPWCNQPGFEPPQHYAEPMIRDYRAEAVGIGAGVRVSRDGTEKEIAALFLPGNDEFVGPGDPDGTKGMREWHDTHQPKEGAGDRGMVPGRIERRSY